MNSKVKTILIFAVIVVVLGGVFLALKLTEPKDKDKNSSSSSSSMQSILLYDKNEDVVSSVEITNETGSYTISKKDSEFTVDGFDGLPLDQSYLQNIAKSVASITAKKIIEENPSDLGKYGLDKPTATAIVKFSDSANTEKKVYVGSEAPTEGTAYLSIDGEKAVYLVDATQFTGLTYKKELTIEMTQLAKPESDDKYPIVDEVTLERKDLAQPITLTYDSSLVEKDQTDFTYDKVHRMTSPIKSNVNVDLGTPFIRTMFGLTAKDVEKVHPTEDDLKNTGISDPTMTITLKSEGKTHILKIGKLVPKTDDRDSYSYYYGKYEGIDVIYKFEESTIPYQTVKAINMVSGLISDIYFTDLSKVEITTKDKTDILTFGKDGDKATVKLNDKDINSEIVSSFYQYFLRSSVEEISLEKPQAEKPEVKIVLTTASGKQATYEYYNNGYRKGAIVIDGKPTFICSSSYIERMLSNIQQLENGEQIVQNW